MASARVIRVLPPGADARPPAEEDRPLPAGDDALSPAGGDSTNRAGLRGKRGILRAGRDAAALAPREGRGGGSGEAKEGGGGVGFEGGKRLGGPSDGIQDLSGGAVAEGEPDHLGGVAVEEAQLMEVRVLREDGESPLRGELPDLAAGGALEAEFADVGRSRVRSLEGFDQPADRF